MKTLNIYQRMTLVLMALPMGSYCFSRPKPDKTPSIVNSVWSYTLFQGIKSLDVVDGNYVLVDSFTFFRYTVPDIKTEINGLSYYPLMTYETCEYQEESANFIAYLRQDGDRIYRYENATDTEILLYDFTLTKGDTVRVTDEDSVIISIGESTTVTTPDNADFSVTSIRQGNEKVGYIDGYNNWIKYVGGSTNFIEYYNDTIVSIGWHGSLLNYYRSGDGSVIYKNALKFFSRYTESDFKPEDCAIIEANGIKMNGYSIKSHIQSIGQNIFYTSPSAIKFDVYTLDAVKVGEATFHNGEAVVKVDRVPATYLYIVTYPDGRRESGKVMVK